MATRRLHFLTLALALAGLLALAMGVVQPRLRARGGGLAGVVVDASTGQPVAGALVATGEVQATSDGRGRYQLDLPAGVYALSAQAPGYLSMTQTYQRVEAGAVGQLDWRMIPREPSPEQIAALDRSMRELAQELPPELEAEARARGFALSAVTEVPTTVRVLMPDGAVVVMEMDEYLKGVVPHEVPPYWPVETLRAQAVAARSYAATRRAHADQGADVCTTVHCQVWSGTHYETTDSAVDATHGVAATYGGAIIYAFFFGHCDGHTRNVEQVWGGYLPYCRSVACPCGFDSMWGHGVGMCQEGARVLATQGHSHVDILRHYYTGIAGTSPRAGEIVGAAVQPAKGDERTTFAYEATYLAGLGDQPVAAYVTVDGKALPLRRHAPTAEGAWTYRATARLAPGAHTYRLTFDDGYGHVASYPAEGQQAGPLVEPASPAAPTPTPLPPPPGGVAEHATLDTTAADWARGSQSGTQVASQGDGALTLAAGQTQGIYTSPTLVASAPFIALGALWHGSLPSGAKLDLEVRTGTEGAALGAWRACRWSEDGPRRHGQGSTDLVFGEGSAWQYRLTLRANANGAAPVVEGLQWTALDARAGPSAAQLAAEAARSSAAARSAPAGPAVIARALWGADEAAMSWPPVQRQPQAIILHHTGAPANGVDGAAMVRALYYYDAVVRERGDLGYNYLLDAEGHVFEGRTGGPGAVGAHAGRYDWGSIGVALLGDYERDAVPPALAQSLTEFLAAQCAAHLIDPTAQRPFLDRALPTVMGHREATAATCPGSKLQALVPELRRAILAAMTFEPPQIEITHPADGAAIRAVLRPEVAASAVISRVEYYVDGELAGSDAQLPGAWRWNTLGVAPGAHALRAVAVSAAGRATSTVTVQVDNTPPEGTVSAPAWLNTARVPVTIHSSDATRVQYSNAWVWEGEDLHHAPGTGARVSDAGALNGAAWLGRGGQDAPGGWYGPYTCLFSTWRSYDVYYRLRAPSDGTSVGLATLDVADDQGRRVYDQRALAAADFARSDAYEEFRLALRYGSRWPTCDDPDVRDGLEFRVWFSGAGDLALDRVTVFSAPEPVAPVLSWSGLSAEGTQALLVRLLDDAGNASDHTLTVGLDLPPPQWLAATERPCVRDLLAGLAPESAAWSASSDSAQTWGAWRSWPLADA
ncbi:MAG: SpoIID/LytB domain-containing protein, partial [Chloroflexota bacterium]